MTRALAIGAAVLVVLLGFSGWLLKESYAENGKLEAAVSDRDAVIQQKEEDAELSASIIAKQQQALSDLDARTGAAIQEVYRAPTSTICAQSAPMRAATRSLRSLFAEDGGAHAGREPAAAVR